MATNHFVQGQRVSLSGLTSQPAYNDRQVLLESWDSETHRWVVVLDDSNKFKVKPENLIGNGCILSDKLETPAPMPMPMAVPGGIVAGPESEPDAQTDEKRILVHIAPGEKSETTGVTYFPISISLPDGTTDIVKHRYNEFLSFYNELGAEESLSSEQPPAPFPRKIRIVCGGQAEKLEERRVLLERWLQRQFPQVHTFADLDNRWATFLSNATPARVL